ncbi:DUF2071 domain-containing protein [Sphingobacterium corticis]|uniref:DUF2071 domain-containing protein n=1 Tax=Sphingobacterium corticis TaxID=1812823 RepID=A0ABW5NKL0_9SPHI
MFSQLKNHPFAVNAHFDQSIILTFAVSREQLAPLLPPSLQLDTYQDKWAFLAVALVRTSALRPAGFPTWMGQNFFLIGYRIFVRYTDQNGRRLRGLLILKSQTDKKQMSLLGNVFTHYRYEEIKIQKGAKGSNQIIEAPDNRFRIAFQSNSEDVKMPIDSPFYDWKDARKFAGPLPHTFTYLSNSKEMLIVEGQRQNWIPKPVQINSYNIPYFSELGIKNPILASAFQIKDIPYHWKKGRLERCL